MSKMGIKEKVSDIRWNNVLAVPALILIFTCIIRNFTPVFDSLIPEFNGICIMAATIAVLLILLFDGKERKPWTDYAIPAAVALSLLYFLEKGDIRPVFVLLIIALVIMADKEIVAATVFAFFGTVFGATLICAKMGFIRNYDLYHIRTCGFINLWGLGLTLSLMVFSLVAIIITSVRNKRFGKLIRGLVLSGLISVLLVGVCLKGLNLHAAVEEGIYEIYVFDTGIGLEVHMKGFDDYCIVAGEDEATGFSIVPVGDHYFITTDSYGVSKTLCVIDGRLTVGNYDQSANAHLWDIEAVPDTPFFIISNVETGLRINTSDGNIVLDDLGGTFRIGSQNLDYYEDQYNSSIPGNSLSRAEVTSSSESVYTGHAVTLTDIKVKMDGVVLTEGEDYEVTYWNNYLPGRAWADIRGIGEYEGVLGLPFEIVYGDRCDDPFYRDIADYVVRMYRMAYLRYPSPEEVRDYVQILVGSNRTPDSVVWDAFYNGGFDVSNAQLIEAVYRLMLLRNGSRDELSLWIAELDRGVSRQDVITAISESPDYQNIWHNFGNAYR